MKENYNGLKKLSENAKKLAGQTEVSFGEIFNEGFIQANTDFESIDDLFMKAGFNVETKEDFENIPQEDIDSFVRDNTNFEDFNAMYKSATTEYVKKQLFKGIK
ncbi:hypothetical protein [Acinetobacter haemolyticus]|uniref:hypothetical protein n=1 Tax=Acinetobacter haemolyticus TaxID=29430 RepID=UPI001331EC46|nr:hypothetical protein [Acinetobacter haemolyticus]QHI17222.1 hypothetical protein AhaeAN4_11825 [Acinetobacter haemolyticus]